MDVAQWPSLSPKSRHHLVFHCPELKDESVDTPDKQKLFWHGCSSGEFEQLATSSCYLETSLATEAQGIASTTPTTPFASLSSHY
jgi:hypothetical protein